MINEIAGEAIGLGNTSCFSFVHVHESAFECAHPESSIAVAQRPVHLEPLHWARQRIGLNSPSTKRLIPT